MPIKIQPLPIAIRLTKTWHNRWEFVITSYSIHYTKLYDWMGTVSDMMAQIRDRLNQGFRCLKLKIGALDFDTEFEILSRLRKNFHPIDLEIRLDANGAFQPKEALEILYQLSDLHIHSVEQPILPGQLDEMAVLCETSPVPIALDEELIGKHPKENKEQLLKMINRNNFV